MAGPKDTIHSEFSARLHFTFKAGHGDNESDQIMRELVAILNLQKRMGGCSDWIKQAMLERIMRDRASLGSQPHLAALGQVQSPPNVNVQTPEPAQAEASAPVDKTTVKQAQVSDVAVPEQEVKAVTT